MSWSALLPKQFVSFTDGNDSPFTKLHGAIGGDKFMTKDEALYYLNVTAANLNVMTSGSQWVWKELLASGRTKAWRGIAPFCVQAVDVRPYPMISDSLYNQKHIGSTYTDITPTYATCKQGEYDLKYNGYGLSGLLCQAISWAIGYRVYPGTTTSLARLPDGYYEYHQNGLPCACHLVNSIITEITPITV